MQKKRRTQEGQIPTTQGSIKINTAHRNLLAKYFYDVKIWIPKSAIYAENIYEQIQFNDLEQSVRSVCSYQITLHWTTSYLLKNRMFCSTTLGISS